MVLWSTLIVFGSKKQTSSAKKWDWCSQLQVWICYYFVTLLLLLWYEVILIRVWALINILTCQLVILYRPEERQTKCTCSGLPLALCWSVYCPLKNLQVELFPLQIPQASRETLEPRMWSHPTACMHRETHVTLNGIKIVTVLTKTKKRQLKFLSARPSAQTKDQTYEEVSPQKNNKKQ